MNSIVRRGPPSKRRSVGADASEKEFEMVSLRSVGVLLTRHDHFSNRLLEWIVAVARTSPVLSVKPIAPSSLAARLRATRAIAGTHQRVRPQSASSSPHWLEGRGGPTSTGGVARGNAATIATASGFDGRCLIFFARRGSSLARAQARPPAQRRIASADASMSASVVDQFETAIRMACMPCHVVPPAQQVPSC